MDLREICANITPPDMDAYQCAKHRWDSLAKPLGGLGLFETMTAEIAALTGDTHIRLQPRKALILCADNGVTARNVTQSDSSVTGIVAREIAAGRTAVCAMARTVDCPVTPVDMGIRDFVPCAGVIDRRVGNGTADFTQGPAMPRGDAERAILTGFALVEKEYYHGTRLIAAGEMGIGNTVTAGAVTAVLLNRAPEEVTGRGAGVSDEGLCRRIQAVREGIRRNQPDASDPVDVLAKVGGYDLAGLCGIYLGGAFYGVPVVMDGFPSTVAALCAVRLCPGAAKAIFASHMSTEPGAKWILRALNKIPPLHAQMHLGEGTGAVALIPLLDMALSVYRTAYTFTDADIPPYTPFTHTAPDTPSKHAAPDTPSKNPVSDRLSKHAAPDIPSKHAASNRPLEHNAPDTLSEYDDNTIPNHTAEV